MVQNIKNGLTRILVDLIFTRSDLLAKVIFFNETARV